MPIIHNKYLIANLNILLATDTHRFPRDTPPHSVRMVSAVTQRTVSVVHSLRLWLRHAGRTEPI